MNIKYRNNVRAFTLLFIVTSVAIFYSAQPAQTQVLVLADSILTMGKNEQINLSSALIQTNNDSSDRFLREQLTNSSSTTPTALQSSNSGWTQPIGWLFGLVFVIMGTLVAWSKYIRKR
ncbi:hypothetical protein [Chamaesiphon sp. OTE_20_metabat_361]|uniref:hypothetical protein n=1 Tax=Chamaesiphon sp. OTE_20_metabat_361 TaxID=2964689 RepID=UPI00286A151D|nr:hypothetical protein [Chamaesiphon sp. OTE_20_metabat_361]